jgi:uncharacterized protein YdiU (UPF0061 family)
MQTLDTLNFDNTFARLPPSFHTRQPARGIDNPRLVALSASAARQLDLDPDALSEADLAEYFSGNRPLPGSEPLAMVYAGHQFGQYAGQLGDGRGLLLGEVVSKEHGRWDLHLKGAGRTPYSRFGDGRAVLRSSIREFLCSEAMTALGIPSSRALCVVDSDTRVQREQIEHGATILRMARSHIRFGHFEHFHYTKQPELLLMLADYTVDRYIPEFNGRPERYAELLRHATVRTATMIAHWQAVGFAHGVLNTDNMSIIGETFDYGPFGFLDEFDPTFICNHSDERGRYSFERQPSIGLWNLNALAHSLSSLIEDTDAIRDALLQYEPQLVQDFSRLMRAKLGLSGEDMGGEDNALLSELLELLAHNRSDYTLFFRRLCDFDETTELSPLRDDFMDLARFDRWAGNYRARLLQQGNPRAQRQETMRGANPKFILRNYLAQNAIAQAEQGDYSEVRRLHAVLQDPYSEQPGNEAYAAAPPDWGKHLEVSCSS